ncbi:MAG: class I SAM-dependent methyltransferase [Bdellovibrionota bacterium]
MIFFADKPAGVATHTSLSEAERSQRLLEPADGFIEMLTVRRDSKLWPIHRLDKETTGCLAYADTREDAELARVAFENRSVKKRYLFVTDRDSKTESFERESSIEKSGKEYVSSNQGTPNSKTIFKKLESKSGFHLWEAFPETGKAHQIRLHAQDSGIAILGDSLHGGTKFPAMCLHSSDIELPESLGKSGGKLRHTSEPPRYFTDLTLLENQRLCRWLAAVDRRERLLRSTCFLFSEAPTTLRWIHSEGDPLRAEKIGDVVHFSWFSERLPNEQEWKSIHALREIMGWNLWYFQQRGDRGREPNEEVIEPSSLELPVRWNANEGEAKFEFRRDSGLSPGLFLDQRANREMVRQASPNKTVLNLFSYTGGFSVIAAQAGAQKVVSVDVSKTFLEWTKRNFELNSISLDNHEFRAMDAREYLAWAKKKELKFDLVICDPPSFGRSKTSVFKLEKDIGGLIASLLAVTASGGTILFSVNFEAWENDEFIKRVREATANTGRKAKLAAAPPPDWDFELPHTPRNMKAVLIELA